MTQMVAPQQRMANLRGLLDKMKPQLALALPAHMKADRMARIALTTCLRTPKLLEADPASFAGAMLTCAQIGLEPDGREAHIVPFYNNKRRVLEVQVIPDYKGLAKLARQSREIKVLDWREVRRGDNFSYRYGTGATLTHVPADEPAHTKNGDRWDEARPVTHCYALAVLSSGETVFEVMRVEDIEWHRDRYSRASGDGPWVTDFPAMGAKTCFRKLSKKLPASTDLRRAVELDERAEAGQPQDLGDVFTASIEDVQGTPAADDKPRGALDTLADKMEEKPTPADAAATAMPADGQTDLPGTVAPATEPEANDDGKRKTLLDRIGKKLDGMAAKTMALKFEQVGLRASEPYDQVDLGVLEDLAKALGA
jgi:recombination protein RecT